MANVLGAGISFRALDPVSTVRPRLADPPPWAAIAAVTSDAVPVETADTAALLARITALLEITAAGLALPELRARLGETTDSLRRALAAGLRSKRFRRVGAHNKLRYVLNV